MAKRRPTHDEIAHFEKSIKEHPGWPVIVSEGDSWFAYPNVLRGSIITKLKKRGNFSSLRLESNGDEVRFMLGLEQRRKLEKYLSEYEVDVLLFSGGGNDIVGDQFCMMLRQYEPGMTWQECINEPRVKRMFGLIKNGYEELIGIRDATSKDTLIMTHGYDFPIPSKVGVCGMGPWMLPSLEYRGIKKKSDQRAIARNMLERFETMMIGLEKRRKFEYVRTQGTLKKKDWANEIHPTSDGFRDIARHFRVALRAHFPDHF